MNRRTMVATALAVAVIAAVVWGVDWGGREPAPVDVPPAVPEVDLEQKQVWMDRLEEAGSVVFREQAGTRSPSDELASVTVTTFGPLGAGALALATEDLSSQLVHLQAKIDAVPGSSAEAKGRTGELRLALDAAQLLLAKARIELVVDMLGRGDYATIAVDAPRPPEVDGFDRVIHGPVPGPDGKSCELVFFVDQNNARFTEASEYRAAIYWEYWRAFVDDFNQRSIEDRKARIALHDRAQEQRSGGTVEEEMTPEELQAAVLVGPLTVDRVQHLLGLRR
jgi:hypothetical protein